MFEKKFKTYNPQEARLVDAPIHMREEFEQNARKAALYAADIVTDPDELSDVLEMLGVKPYTRASLYENRLEAKRKYKETYIKPEDRDESQTA